MVVSRKRSCYGSRKTLLAAIGTQIEALQRKKENENKKPEKGRPSKCIKSGINNSLIRKM